MDRINTANAFENRDVSTFLQQIEELIQTGRIKEAIELARTALELYPRTSELYLKLGVALDRDGDINGAISLYQQAILIEIKQPFWVYATLCERLLWQEQITTAIDVGERGIKLYPEQAEIYRHLGAALARAGNLERAIDIYRQAIALEPKQPLSLYVTLSELLKTTNNLEAAIAVCRQGIELDRSEPNFHLYANLGDALTERGSIESAIAAYQQALKIEPEQQSIVSKLSSWDFNAGLFLLSTGKIDTALKHFQAVERVEEWTENYLLWPSQGAVDWPLQPWDLNANFASLLPDNARFPKISIVTPSFEQGEYLEETILSVLHQQYPNLEYIIVDGGSSDRTPEILAKYRHRVAQIIVEPDKGQSDAINKGFRQSSGELLLWLNSDDMLFPGALHYLALIYLQTQCDIIAGICLVHSDRNGMLSASKPGAENPRQIIALRKPKVRQADFNVVSLADVSARWSTGYFFFQPEVIFTRAAWQQAGGMLDTNLNYAMDHDLWLRFAQNQSRLEVISYPVALFRKHSLQKTADNLASVRELLTVVSKYYIPSLNREKQLIATDKLAGWLAAYSQKMLIIGQIFPESLQTIQEELNSHANTRNIAQVSVCRELKDIEVSAFDVIIAIVVSPDDEITIATIKTRNFSGLLVAWLWNEYTHYRINARIAELVDICFPRNELGRKLLSHPDAIIAPPVEISSWQWTVTQAQQYFALYGKNERSSDCCIYVLNNKDRDSRSLIEKCEVLCLDEDYFKISGEKRFARLANFKVAIFSSVEREIPLGLFDALLCGQIPIILGKIEELEKVISPEWQEQLPIILLNNDTFKGLSPPFEEKVDRSSKNLQEIVRDAVSLFDREGIEGRIRRHQFVLNDFLLIHRLNIITRVFKQLFLGFVSLEQDRLIDREIDLSIEAIIGRGSTMEVELQQSLASYLSAAKEAIETGKPDNAIALYREASEIYPENTEIYRHLGIAYEKQGNLEGQIENYLKAVELEAEQPFWVYTVLIDKLQSVDKVERALEIGKQALELYPEQADIYRNLGVVHDRHGNALETITHYYQAIKLKTEQPFWVYCALVDRLYWQGRLDEAIDIANRGIELYPEQADLYRHLGLAQQKKGIIPGTIKNYRRAIQLQPVQPSWVYTTLCNILYSRGELDKAIALYNKAIEYVAESEKSLFLEQLREATIAKASLTKKQDSPANSSTAINAPQLFAQMSDKEFIQYIYLTFLKRKADPKGLNGNLKALENNVPRTVILENILTSQEFSIVNNQTVLPELSNYEFLHAFWEFMLGRFCDWDAEQVYLGHLERGLSRVQFILEITKTQEFKERIENLDLAAETRVAKKKNNAWLMGTERFVNQDEWDKVLFEILCQEVGKEENSVFQEARSQYQPSPLVAEYLANNNTPLVSVITSLFKGRDYIEAFMKNITTQTIFEGTELIIIDANSPENEIEIIQPYLTKFPNNIKYIRTENTIGIYEAWNLGAIEAKSKFLTNANADDCRRFDCLEKQAEALLENQDVDLVYQDLFYSLTANLPFEIIAKCNFKTELPERATQENMLQFNSPHNAPMWRKELHEKVGLFNSIYRSAGDYELWLRALLKEGKFIKIKDPVVAYYNNPSGISTRNESAGSSEAQEIQVIYNRLFDGGFFSMSQSEFVDFCQAKFGLERGLQISPSGSSWRDKISFFDRFFEEKTKELAKNKFYVSFAD